MTVQVETWSATQEQYRHLMVYGDSGVGKTRFGATWPRPVFLDADKGMMSVDTAVGRINIESWLHLQDAYALLKSPDAQKQYDTLVFDTLNEIQHIAMQNVLGSFPEIKRPYKSLPQVGDYGKALNDFDLLIREFLKLPYHQVFIAQVKKKEFVTDPIEPQLTGKHTTPNIARKMSVIGYMNRTPIASDEGGQVIVPVMYFNEQEFVSKDRTGKLPASITEPTYDKLAFYWKGGPK